MNIRNFCIIAHIDHGKSTLADRMLEITGAIRKLEHAQMLDRMELEQERGITIKLTPARMQRKGYEFNLIDTPGHVDFQYEVSRSLAAVEGAILLVDASQWIQAQTLSTLYQAIDQHLTIIPVLNKIDLPAANPERVAHEIENVIGIDTSEIIQVSGKTWENVDKVLDAIIERIQDPLSFKKSHPKKYRLLGQDPQEGATRALIFDSVYDPYKGVLAYVKMVDGNMKAYENLNLIYSENTIEPTEVGHFTPEYQADKMLHEGQIGYIVTGQKSVRDVQIWDTILWWLPKMKKQMITDDGQKIADDEINKVTYDIIWCAMEVHKHLWWWNREKNYQLALIHELEKKWLQVKKEVQLDLMYKDTKLANQYVDLMVNNKVIIEMKSKWFLQDIDYKQIRTYLNSSDKKVGLLFDFWGRKLLYKRLEKEYQKNLPLSSEKNLPLSSYIIPGFKKVKPFVYAGVYPLDTNDYDKLKDSLEKLSLNDSAIEYELEDSKALGFGFRCGFLWMLHMDIVKERLSREYNIDTIFTIPTVIYLVRSKNLSIEPIKSWWNITTLIKTGMYKHILGPATTDEEAENRVEELKPRLVVKSWADMVEQGVIDEIYEPVAAVEVVGPEEYAGNIMALCQEYRGKLTNMEYIDETRVVRHYELPMGEIIIDFYDRLKSATKGYATMNYEFKKYQPADLVKLDVYINNEKVEALSWVIHKDKSYYLGKEVVEKLKTLIPKHLFVIPLQAGIGTKMIARENIAAMKKDVLAKCYGWDVTRKRKLLAKQKEGKKKMKAIWSVNVPSDVFIKMVARGD